MWGYVCIHMCVGRDNWICGYFVSVRDNYLKSSWKALKILKMVYFKIIFSEIIKSYKKKLFTG